MSAREFWMQVLIHFTAVVLGGFKLAVISGIFWYVVRRKYLAKWMGAMMKDLMTQMSAPPEPVPGYTPTAADYPSDTFGGPAVAVGSVREPARWSACSACKGMGMVAVEVKVAEPFHPQV